MPSGGPAAADAARGRGTRAASRLGSGSGGLARRGGAPPRWRLGVRSHGSSGAEPAGAGVPGRASVVTSTSVTRLDASHRGVVLVAGSHGGIFAAWLAARAGVRAV